MAKLRDFPENSTDMEHFESDEVDEIDGDTLKSDYNDIEQEQEQEEDHNHDHEEEEDHEHENESMEHIRKKMATMEAEAQKILALSRQMDEKVVSSSSFDHDLHNNTNTNTTSINNENKKKDNNNNIKSIPSSLNNNNNNSGINTNINNTTTTKTPASTPLMSRTEDTLEPVGMIPAEKEEDQKVLDERSVFVKNLDKGIEADQLKEYFESCGAIERITILANKFTGEARGCAYIQFKSKVAVANALLLDGKIWQGKEIEVKAKRTNLPIWMLERGRARGRGGFRGRSSFRGRGRGFMSYRGYRGGGYRGRGYWHPYAGY